MTGPSVFTKFSDASKELKWRIVTISGLYPGAVAYVAEPGVAERLGFSVSAVLDGLAVGLLTDDEGAARVFRWGDTLERRVKFEERVRTDGLPEPILTVSFLLLEGIPEGVECPYEEIVSGNWLGIRAFRGLN